MLESDPSLYPCGHLPLIKSFLILLVTLNKISKKLNKNKQTTPKRILTTTRTKNLIKMLKISHTWMSGMTFLTLLITSRESNFLLTAFPHRVLYVSPQTLINTGMSYHFSDYSSIILLLQSNLLHLNQLLLPPFIFTDRFLRISLPSASISQLLTPLTVTEHQLSLSTLQKLG